MIKTGNFNEYQKLKSYCYWLQVCTELKLFLKRPTDGKVSFDIFRFF